MYKISKNSLWVVGLGGNRLEGEMNFIVVICFMVKVRGVRSVRG